MQIIGEKTYYYDNINKYESVCNNKCKEPVEKWQLKKPIGIEEQITHSPWLWYCKYSLKKQNITESQLTLNLKGKLNPKGLIYEQMQMNPKGPRPKLERREIWEYIWLVITFVSRLSTFSLFDNTISFKWREEMLIFLYPFLHYLSHYCNPSAWKITIKGNKNKTQN